LGKSKGCHHDPDHQLSPAGVRHGRQRFYDIPGNIFSLTLPSPRAGSIECRLPIEKLPLGQRGPAGYVIVSGHINSLESFGISFYA